MKCDKNGTKPNADVSGNKHVFVLHLALFIQYTLHALNLGQVGLKLPLWIYIY